MNANTIAKERFPFQDRISIEFSNWDFENISFLYPLSSDYKNIIKWYSEKVRIGLDIGTRKLIRIERNGRIVAMGIAKNEDGEKKICTVRVAPDYFGKGLAIRIFEELMDWLGTDRPHLTVSAKKVGGFERIFERYGFKLTSSITGLYIPGEVEFLFNEPKQLNNFFNNLKC